jgi:hypothetical protein
VCGFDGSNCVVVADPREPADVARQIDSVAAEARQLLLVYYAGHGLLDDQGALHLGVAGSTRAFTRFDSFSFEGLRAILAKSVARQRVLILDCCFSGQAIGMMGDAAAVATAQVNVAGTYTMTATSATKPAHAPPGARLTAFTEQLLSVLRVGVPDGAEYLDTASIYTSVRTGLLAAGLPEPQQRATNAGTSLFIARNAAWVDERPWASVAARPEPGSHPRSDSDTGRIRGKQTGDVEVSDDVEGAQFSSVSPQPGSVAVHESSGPLQGGAAQTELSPATPVAPSPGELSPHSPERASARVRRRIAQVAAWGFVTAVLAYYGIGLVTAGARWWAKIGMGPALLVLAVWTGSRCRHTFRDMRHRKGSGSDRSSTAAGRERQPDELE